MVKRFAKRALIAALAAVLTFGGAGTALAAVSDEQAELSASSSSAAIYSFSAWSSGGNIVVNMSGYAGVWKLYVNDVFYMQGINSDTYSWDRRLYVSRMAGVDYTLKLVLVDADGNVLDTRTSTVEGETTTFDKDSASCWESYSADSTGYRVPSRVVTSSLSNYISGNMTFEVYRSTSASKNYKKIYSEEKGSASYLSYYDYTAVPGKTYYYIFKLCSGTDDCVTEAKVIARSSVITSKSEGFSVDVDLSVASNGIKLDMSSYRYANQFDIYRSKSKTSGFKKLATVYTPTYTDKTAAAGAVYYYKVIPKCYSSKSGQTYTGKAGEVEGARRTLGDIKDFTATLSGTTSLKLSWSKVAGANAYEIWYYDYSLSGNAYKKAGTTQGTTYTISGLTPGASYAIKLKAQIKSKGVTLSEKASAVYYNMKYDGVVRGLTAKSKRAKLSSDGNSLYIYTRYNWNKVYGASGYIVTAYNNYTGKNVRIAKLTSASSNAYTFVNVSTKTKGLKYSKVMIAPYKGSAVSTNVSSDSAMASLPSAAGITVTRNSDTSAKITWTAVPGATQYTVYKMTDLSDGNWVYVGYTEETSKIDEDLSFKTGYKYLVQASSSTFNVYGGYSSELTKYSKTYSHALAAPKAVKFTSKAVKNVGLSWGSVSGATSYVVYRSTAKDGTYSVVGSTTKPSFKDTKVTKTGVYYYKVVARTRNNGGIVVTSAYSGAAAARVK